MTDRLEQDLAAWIFAQARHPAGGSKGGQFKSTTGGKGGAGGGGGDPAGKGEIGDKIRGEPNEHGAAWDADGNLIAEYSSDSSNQVKTPSEVIARGEGGYRVHNHPPSASPDDVGGGGLSPGDLDQAAWNRVHETTVVSVLDGEPIDFTAGGFDKLTDNAGDGSLLGGKMDASLRGHMADLDTPITRGFMRGKMGQNSSQSLYFATKTHAAMKLTSKEYGFSYKANWKGVINDTTGKVGTLDDALDALGIK